MRGGVKRGGVLQRLISIPMPLFPRPLLYLALVLGGGSSALAQLEKGPNFLFVVADDLNTHIGPYVDASLKVYTPNLNRLAREGVSFSRAYTQYPVCGPARAAFMSGLYPETNGVTGNGFEMGNHRIATPALADHPTLAGFLRERGYFTARVSKIFHLGVPGGIERGEAGSDDPDSWDYAVNLMAPETLTPGNWEKLSQGNHYGSVFARLELPDGAELTQADVLAANQAIAILENRATPRPVNSTNRSKFKPDAPFFLAVGFVRPHVPLIAASRHFAHYPEDKVKLPHVPENDFADIPEPALALRNETRFGMDGSQQRRAISAYHASISFMDEQLGRLLDALDRLKLRESTVVVFISDHGYNLGEHSTWQKQNLWEESVRVPLIVSVPGTSQAGKVAKTIVELNDLYPTFAELGGLGEMAPAILQGESLVPLLEDPHRPTGDQIAFTISARGGASIRTERWRYNRWGEDADGLNEELYDHANDPREYVNLARLPEHGSNLAEIRVRFERVRRVARGN